MSSTMAYGGYETAGRDRAHTLFGQTMGLVAITAGVFALGAYLAETTYRTAGGYPVADHGAAAVK